MEAEIADVVAAMARAWNKGDAVGFAAVFAEDADLANVHGMRLHGRAAIAAMYDILFRSVFRHRRVEWQVETARPICENVMLVHVLVIVYLPGAADSADHSTMCTLLMRRAGDRWWVALQHSTTASEGGEA
jgi:uncharacterized protein (TIGR02246 family)